MSATTKNRYDVAIIGAGPAGIAAAVEVTKAGLSAIVLDEQPAPGGQIYRGIETSDEKRTKVLGADYAAGRDIAKAFRACSAEYLPGATVWNIDSALGIDVSLGQGSKHIQAGAIVVATGAIERPTPMPGWTLPGVTTAGALQILLKANGVVSDDVVFVGSGPLLSLIAAQMLKAGVKPRAIVETVPQSRYVAALKHLPAALGAASYLVKGMAMMLSLRRAGVPIYRDATGIRIEGNGKAEAVTFTSGGKSHRLETTSVALHQGIVPNQQVTRLLRCDHEWNKSQHCFVPKVDEYFETTMADVYVAGDGAGIGGAVAARLRGRLAGLRIAEKAGRGNAQERRSVTDALMREAKIRPLLETLYAPSPEILAPADDTLVCRCEEVTAGDIRKAVDLGAPGPNQVKSFLRSGMGPCQGRMCGLAVSEIIASRRGEPISEIGYYRIRPPLKPLLLSELAALESEEAVPADLADESAAVH
ncbi:NAD(P)/FAD-dependent oxidoreductase [Afifella sp. JA880]|uniref:FAD/NAD(P)-dependent oxidoreductase n=1 Tax=Afifella sp. JA880 TaxID=2975280 RepID=UPI0021BBA007|nr:NAD(P)/FAD-dependent oxidoreductase [Afifella sp. JA880]MCT8268468.1 NAD(P)/FAD-dependent oxidoreductase [Afifella sp. JA880]